MRFPAYATETMSGMRATTPSWSRQQPMLNVFRLLGLVIVVLVEVGAATAQPRPGAAGQHLGVLLAMLGFAVGVLGAVRSRERSWTSSAAFLLLLVACSSVLVGLQANGPGFLGVFVAVSAATMRVPGRPGAAIAAFALVALPIAEILGKERSAVSIALLETGVLAFYAVSLLADRLRRGQERAEELLAELERSRDAQASAAVLGERQRLAREMHDVLAHSLSGLALQVEAARLVAESHGADPAIIEPLERAHRLARTGLDEARRAIGLLRGDELPGPERLPDLASEFERDASIPTSITITGPVRQLDPDARLTLYRAAQEALTNVRKHARTSRVELRLDYEPRGTRLTVEDFGDPAAAASPGAGGGYGLTGMRERAELIGGELTARRTAGGFRVDLWVPC